MKKKFNLFEKILIIVLVLIFFQGNNLIEKIVKPLVVFVATLPVLISINNKKHTVRFNICVFLWMLVVIYFFFSVFFTNDIKTTCILLIYLIAGVLFLFFDFKIDFYEQILKILFIVCIVNSIAIIISAIIPDLSQKIYSIWVTSTTEYLEFEKSVGSYSGLSGEKALAAVTMNIVIAIAFSKILYNDNCDGRQKIKYIVVLIIAIVALLLTSKRMLTAVPIFNLLIIYFLSRDKNKIIKICKVAIPAIILFAICIIYVPKLGNVVNRFFNDGDLGRENLKSVCIKMYESNKIFGTGFGSFNQYLYDTGFRYYGERWYFYAHNIYYEILGETGTIGIILFILAIGICLYTTIKLFRINSLNVKRQRLLFVSLYIQLLFILYGMTGNTFYYVQQQYLYLFSIATMLAIRKSLKEDTVLDE